MLNDFKEAFNVAYAILINGGWVAFAAMHLYMFYRLYMDYIKIRWYSQQDFVLLRIVSPGDNEKSPLAFEQIFGHLHSVQGGMTWPEIHIEGQFQPWITWEIVSIGGNISNYVQVISKFRDTVEAAIYSQYPNAEITEAEDYLAKLPNYYPDTSEYDLWGLEFRYMRPNFYPIRTYLDFEHSTAETFVDPVTGIWEEMAKMNPYEMLIVQFFLRPIDDDDWKKPGYELVQKLKGVPEANKRPEDWLPKVLGVVFGPILDAFIRPGETKPAARQQDEPPSLMLHLTEGEKTIINAIERKLSKLAYQTKIVFLYIAPKEKFNVRPVWGAIVGSFKSVNAHNLNALKPDTKKWTKINYKIFKNLEKPILELFTNLRKIKFMKRVRKRWYFIGAPPNIMNTEELATLIHFPQIDVTVPNVEKVQVVKEQPPPELPIAGEL
ncbi:MAG: hypothetical protein U1C57_03280 [Candidatus Doudnabacteria bacterium]|nr:hypothetical protein [Candidatus Doudnabacteria bacterium]